MSITIPSLRISPARALGLLGAAGYAVLGVLVSHDPTSRWGQVWQWVVDHGAAESAVWNFASSQHIVVALVGAKTLPAIASSFKADLPLGRSIAAALGVTVSPPAKPPFAPTVTVAVPTVTVAPAAPAAPTVTVAPAAPAAAPVDRGSNWATDEPAPGDDAASIRADRASD